MTRVSDGGKTLRRLFLVCQGFAAAVLVAFIAGSLIFTGGRVGEMQSTNWAEVWSWPVFPVPAWLLIVPAVIAAIVVIPMCIRTPARRANLFLGAIGQTIGAAAAAIAFMFLFPADTGVFVQPVVDGYLGMHWIALPFDLFCVIVLIVALVKKGGEYEKLRAAGGDVG